jgi:hypothetical protein
MTDSPGFDLFWAIYPRHIARKTAQKAFVRALKDCSVTVEQILAGARAYAAACVGTDPRYIKHPTTWLNGGCWDDEQLPPVVYYNRGTSNGHQRRLDAWEAAFKKLGCYVVDARDVCGSSEAPVRKLPPKGGG